MKKTLIVSVFAGCGKTWLKQHRNQYLSDIIDDLYWKKECYELYTIYSDDRLRD